MSTHNVGTVLIVGAGAIGTSWAADLLARGVSVVIAEPDEAVHAGARVRVTDYLGELGRDDAASTERLTFGTDLAEAASTADLVIEAGPERLAVKREIFDVLDRHTAPEVLLTTSSSGLLISRIAEGLTHPDRVLVAHPFNPPHLVPLVELVGGTHTSATALDQAEAFFGGIGKRTIRVGAEIPGHIVNRLQAALWREAYHLVDIGAATVADIDTAIAWGPGLRWSLLGPFATQHISGGGQGIRHVLEHLGPPMVEWWEDLGAPELSPALVDRICAGVDDELGLDDAPIRRRRDRALLELLSLKHAADLP
ncbi:3-hydroxyacyl-CoA dehydrogenase [Gordonia oryzae]|uniref:3-hydroxyacyl-CoA dehydrogenase n=1 Tax=Gordonia oryzae TaxID=2487349 RepID=A0A3N4HEL3_9ACTN|nr:3-hydroxyacyl-CoA dehydrogenase NAD-binding domain-containing protein [Gordonia oryzae]RPA64774.1 3-hydroxyacyl-CoA dehydrogenase [Gordonia oryzae]